MRVLFDLHSTRTSSMCTHLTELPVKISTTSLSPKTRLLLINILLPASLLAPVTREEVWQCVSRMGSLKAPGPDGVERTFLQKTLALAGYVGPSVVEIINNFFQTGCLSPDKIECHNHCLDS